MKNPDKACAQLDQLPRLLDMYKYRNQMINFYLKRNRCVYNVIALSGGRHQESTSCLLSSQMLTCPCLGGMPGIPGANGMPGIPGPYGARGDKGAGGEQGRPGAKGGLGGKGDRGQRGQNGSPGKTGPNGSNGKKGEPGSSGAKGDAGWKGEKGDVAASGAISASNWKQCVWKNIGLNLNSGKIKVNLFSKEILSLTQCKSG